MQFCNIEDLKNESDVEQKLVARILFSKFPEGLGFTSAEVQTKPNLRTLTIGKGRSAKLYRPDYVVIQHGLPVLVGEAKHPKESVDEGLREARLYATELNGTFKTGINPCRYVLSCNGHQLVVAIWDSEEPFLRIDFAQVLGTSPVYADFIDKIGKSTIGLEAKRLRQKLGIQNSLIRPVSLIGGYSTRNEEVGYNDFGAKLAIDFMHLFNPQTKQQRTHIARNAYVTSTRREHYVDEIDRVVKNAIPRKRAGTSLIEDSSNPSELLHLLGRGTELQRKIMLLVGPVGAGKSTFVDYFRANKIPADIGASTLWVSVDFNQAPPTIENMEDWIVARIREGLEATDPKTDFRDWATIQKVFGIEIRDLKKGPLSLLTKGSEKYNSELYHRMQALVDDSEKFTLCLARHLAAERSKLLVVVMDNVDKGDREEQLKAFKIVQWIQSWLPCLVFLPIRDVTYEAYKSTPPLDTIIKEFVFRIEPPQFTKVLKERIRLAIDELKTTSKAELVEYHLDNGIRVVYPASEIGIYLACIYRSLYDHDQLLRRMLVGLAGKNIRRAMEIFLDFCRSGHIGTAEILKIRTTKGNYSLPYSVVTRVLLRLNRRFYDGDASHIKNLFQASPDENFPNNLVRFAILSWLRDKQKVQGPTGVQGFHRADSLVSELILHGFSVERASEELDYLLNAGCIYAEHQRSDHIEMDDLIILAPAGFATLQLVARFDYLAACSEETWMSDSALAERIADRIGSSGISGHYDRRTTRNNAIEFSEYLRDIANQTIASAADILNQPMVTELKALVTGIHQRVERAGADERKKAKWNAVNENFTVGEVYSGSVDGMFEDGIFVRLHDGPVGLLHKNRLPPGINVGDFRKNDSVDVQILHIDQIKERMTFQFVGRK